VRCGEMPVSINANKIHNRFIVAGGLTQVLVDKVGRDCRQ